MDKPVDPKHVEKAREIIEFMGDRPPEDFPDSCLSAIAVALQQAADDALEQAARIAKSAWLTSNRGAIGDADREAELSEEIATAIRALKSSKDSEGE